MRLLPREVLAPRDAFHAEGFADRRDARADVAQAEKTQALSGEREARSEPFVPSAGAHVALALRQAARTRDDQAPRQLDGRGAAAGRAGVAHRDAALLQRLAVEAGRARTGEADELEVGELVDQRAREWRALTHQADDVERR